MTVRDSGVIISVSADAGDAGSVEVTADRITLLTGGQLVSGTGLFSTGRGGEVVVTAHGALTISGQSKLRDPTTDQSPPSGIFPSTESELANAGPGGTVTVTAFVITIADGGEIAADSFNTGQAGTVSINTETLRLHDAEISTAAATRRVAAAESRSKAAG